jgi:two-component system response regulator PilR (NtrC family)
VIELRMPALRECREDIPLLARHILDRLARAAGVPPPPLTPEALGALQRYPFPGNVRELENVLERSLALMVGERIDATTSTWRRPSRRASPPPPRVPCRTISTRSSAR